MKRIFLALAVAIISIAAFAQTQQGIVKTRGRMVNGQLVPGVRLSGATITLNVGNPLVSGSQGTFSFPVPSGRTYALVNAQKQGYTLADPDYTRRSFKYSAQNPFYVVLEDEKQRQADINAATKNVRRTLIAQLQAREDEIESLKEQNKLSEEEYQKRLQELYDNQSKSEQLVKEMAERYASTDYDQLDEFNRQVQLYIEEGELQKADSMIRSKGDMERRVAEYHNVIEANRQEREKLEQSEAGAAKSYEDLSLDLLRRSEIFLQTFQQDSALHCMKLRADLDTTKVNALWEYAALCYIQKKYKDCEKYYLICLHANTIVNDVPNIALIQNNLGSLYLDQQFYSSSEKYYMMALENYELLSKENPDTCRSDLANIQNNLGSLYYSRKFYPISEVYYKMALENYERLFKENPDTYRSELANILNNLGALYNDIQDYTISENYYKLALENRELLFKENPDAYRYDLAMTQNNLGTLYYDQQDYPNSEKYFKLALENRELLFKDNPDAYRRDLALTSWNIMMLYDNMYFNEDYEKYLDLALNNYTVLYQAQPSVYFGNLIDLQNRKVLNLLVHGSVDEALVLAQKTYSMDIFGETTKDYLSRCYESKAFEYADVKDFAKAMDSINSAIALVPDNLDFNDTKGVLFLMQGKNEEALKMWKKVLEIDPDFIKKYPSGSALSNGLKKLGLIE